LRVILDTNVFISGVFFTGPPHEILKHWRDGKLQLAISEEILLEYQRVGKELSRQYPEINLSPLIELVIMKSVIL
jgi:uncharacterized protein